MIDLSFFKGKKIFITGHTGFKGTWLSRMLLTAGSEITGYSLPTPTTPSLFELTQTYHDITSLEGDIRDYETISKAIKDFRPDIVLHLAAQPLVRYSYKEPAMTYEVNVMGTVNILDAVRKTDSVVSFLNVTTDKVYENKEWVWGYRENENLCGYDPYSNSKSCSELVTSSYRNSFFNETETSVSTARSGNVIAGGDFAEDRIIPDCIRSLAKGQEVMIRNPYSTRPYQHVLECLSGYLLLAQKQYSNKSYEGAYNFGPDPTSYISNEYLVDTFCKLWGPDASWSAVEGEGPHEANILKLDSSKAKSTLGWAPKWGIKTSIEKIVSWTKRYLDGEDCASITDRQISDYLEHNNV